MEFYFSDSNLTRDKFLNQRLAETKYVPISLFLNFDKIKRLTLNADDVSGAVEKSHFLQLSADKKSVFRRHAFVPKQNVESCTIYVEGVPFHSTDDIIRRTFSAYGTIDRVSVPINRRTGLLQGFGFVEFRTPDMAFNALQAFGAWGRRIRSERYPECMDVTSFCDQVKVEAQSLPDCVENTVGEGEVENSPAHTARPGHTVKRALSSDSHGTETPPLPPVKVTRFAASPNEGSSDSEDADFNPPSESLLIDDTSSTTTTTVATSSLALTNTDSLHERRSDRSSSTTSCSCTTTTTAEDCGDSGVTTDSGAVMAVLNNSSNGTLRPGTAGGIVDDVERCHGDDVDTIVSESAADPSGTVSAGKSDTTDGDVVALSTPKDDTMLDALQSDQADGCRQKCGQVGSGSGRRSRRSRRRWPMLTEVDSDLLQLQIMPLAEWLRFRDQYRSQQQKHFAALKRSLKQASKAVECSIETTNTDTAKQNYQFKEGCVVALSAVQSTTPSKSLLSKVSGANNVDSATPAARPRNSPGDTEDAGRKLLAQLRQQLPGVVYVDWSAVSDQPSHVRFDCAEKARLAVQHPLLSERLPRIISGVEESDYWRHLLAQRESVRRAPAKRPKVRGKDKLMRRLRCVSSKSTLQQDGALVSLI